MQTLSDRLKAALAAREISQSELAARVKLSRGAVSLWISGTTKELTDKNLIKVSHALGISPAWLALGWGDMDGTTGQVREPRANYGDAPSSDLIRELLAGVLGPLGLRVAQIDVTEQGIALTAAWSDTPQQRRRGLSVVETDNSDRDDRPLAEFGFVKKTRETSQKPAARKGGKL